MKCNSCNINDCCGGCKPAKYGCNFNDIQVDPYDASKWKIIINGTPYTVNVPGFNETDTILSTDYSSAVLNYKAEKHTDKVTGEQLGDIINLGDLRDVEFDPSIEGNCYELIYRKFSECGDGCRSAADKWMNFSALEKDSRFKAIRYVRGANIYGCPTYLEVPTNEDIYWFGMWNPNEDGFTWVNPEQGELPRDDKGNPIVMSVDPNTGKPILGTINQNCLLMNLMGNFAMNVYGTWSVIQETPAFSGTFNSLTGDFQITWNDWDQRVSPMDTHVGSGTVTGKLEWTAVMDETTGTMRYHITALKYYKCVYRTDQGRVSSLPIKMTLKAVTPGTGAQTTLMNAYSYMGDTNWTVNFNRTLSCDYWVSVAPGATAGPLNIAYIYVDWIGDDEGYMQANFKNNLFGWSQC